MRRRGLLGDLRHLLAARAHRRFLALCALAAVAGLLEAMAVASIVPFLAVFADPGGSLPLVGRLSDQLGTADHVRMMAILGGAVLAILVLANTVTSLSTWLLLRFANRQGHALSVRLLATYLARPYVFYLDRHTADLQKTIFGEVQRVTTGVLLPAAQIAARLAVVVFISGLLVVVDPRVALVVGAALGTAYALIYVFARAALLRAGRQSIEAGTLRSRHALEALSGAKEIKLLGRESEFIERFERSSLAWADAQTTAQAIGQLPRYAIETIAFALILALALYFLRSGSAAGQILPLLGLYAFAGYRLMPALQQIFAGAAALRASHASLLAVLDDLRDAAPPQAPQAPVTARRLPIGSGVDLVAAAYRYPGDAGWALSPIDLHVPRNASVALVGATGCGKTTVVDLIMGLLQPSQGLLRVDGTAIDEHNVRAWQRSIGHVPQQIFLCDDTIAHNIALGLPDAAVDRPRVEAAARLARLHDFVAGLPKGYDTRVGERGVRLSGGQRQRIGIARALYTDPDLLILDEATSALDSLTENAVLDALQALAGRKTIVMVAHRLSTVRDCDLICVMEQGRIVDRGTFDELMASSARFQALAGAARA